MIKKLENFRKKANQLIYKSTANFMQTQMDDLVGITKKMAQKGLKLGPTQTKALQSHDMKSRP